MKKAADVLYLLATFSLRSGFIEKAKTYSSAGAALFPRDCRHLELQVYALILQRSYDEAGHLLDGTEMTSRNLEYLRARIAILTSRPKAQVQVALRNYLLP